MKSASTFHNKYGIPANLGEPLADRMKYSLLRRHPDLAPYPHPSPRIVDQWQSEKQAAHLMEMTAKAVMLLLLMKTPFRHVWMLCVVVDFSTLYSLSLPITERNRMCMVARRSLVLWLELWPYRQLNPIEAIFWHPDTAIRQGSVCEVSVVKE
jgi:hypothetical protein